jgi:hypothetical protein
MAYGMLTSAALGAIGGLGEFAIGKITRSMEEEAKVKAEVEREARIEEAQIRSEDRATTREDLKYNKLRADTLADKETQYAQDYIVKGEDSQRRQDEKIADELRAQKRENDPTSIDYKIKAQQLESAQQSVNASKSTIENQDIARQVANLELSNKQEIKNLRDQLKTEADKTQQDKIYNRLLILEGKSTKPSFETIDVPIYDNKGEQVKDENTGVPKFRKQLISINPVSQEIKKIGEESAARYNLEDAKAIATTEANDKFGKRNTTFFDTEGDKDNSKEYDDFVKARTSVWVSQEKAKDGMLNSKGVDKPTGTTDKTSTSNEAPFKAVDDPAKQKEYDIIFNKVVKPHESGNKGVNAQNPDSTAGGTWQLVDDTAVQFGAKRGVDGKVSNAEKDRVAPKYYAYVYKITDGDPAAMLAANFGQEAVSNSIGRAESKGTKWWDELKNPKLIQNMPQVYIRAKESIDELKAAGIEPDPRLLDFVNNYTSTRAVSANDSASTIKRMNNG